MRLNEVFVIGAACIGTVSAPVLADRGSVLFVKIHAEDGVALDYFGSAVAVSGAIAIIGANGDDSLSGSAYLYDVLGLQQHFKLVSNDRASGDEFGYSVAISGGVAIIGAPGNDDLGTASGSAYLFNVATGQQLRKLTPNDGAIGDWFGHSVALSGNLAIVSATYDDAPGIDSGSAYIFDVATGQQLFKLTPNDGAPGDNFGYSVSISGPLAIVGAQGDNDQGSDSGSAYLFDATTGQQLFKLVPKNGAENDFFGRSVSISGDRAIVAAQGGDDHGLDSGAAYLFDVATGQQLFNLAPDDGTQFDYFGYSVSISGPLAIVGAQGDDGFSGSAHIFDVATGQRLFNLAPNDGEASDGFGSAVAVSGGVTIVGTPGDDDRGFESGAAYLLNPPIPPAITSSPASVLVGPAQSQVVFEVAAASLYPSTYQWRRAGQPLSDGGNITGATTPTLTILATQADEDLYDCEVANIYGSAISAAAVLGFRPNPCLADLNGDGLLDFFDVAAYLSAFSAGCP